MSYHQEPGNPALEGPQVIRFTDQEMRLLQMSQRTFVAAHEGMVNLNDLCAMQPGGIVRTRGNPADCLKVFSLPDDPVLGCVAGWISEEA